ncbi:MAG: toll/interleukin-1 receptor domain-containing protein [Saprospiraceae bacterium]|jgi:hypothetical protein|nr:toll/interleukin-1 receptor domain-containing protein [Saprospiraceae bacterium]
MKDENIIRDEALNFAKRHLRIAGMLEPIKDFDEVKGRLHDFYSPEAKSIFLDEINKYVLNELQKHRDQNHDGKADQTCGWENKAEKLLFYIRQEVGTLPIVAHQKNPASKTNSKNKVFVSYSHLDEEYLKDIKRHFKPFLKQIDFWDDSKIQPGQKWKKEIRNAINETKIAILLVSTDFLGSEFISTDELPPLLKAAEAEGAVILILILKPCLFEEFVDLNQFQAMNPPGRPISKMDFNEREELYVNLVRQTKRILMEKENDL